MSRAVRFLRAAGCAVAVKNMKIGMAAAVLAMPLAGCGNGAFFGADGPSTKRVLKTADPQAQEAIIVDVDQHVSNRLQDGVSKQAFMDVFGEGRPYGVVIAPGDSLQVTIYEAPPATLFGAGPIDASSLATGAPQRANTMPDISVSGTGTIDIPFAGELVASGKTTRQLARDIAAKLQGKAHLPQVLVSIGRNNAASAVTVVGEVRESARVSLTSKGERLLDALAAGGGTREPVDKISVQVTRGSRVASMPLQAVIQDPRQNIFMQPGDVLTALYQSQSFTALGGVGKPEEIKFEAQGITLAQALGRMGGIRDDRANPRGVFIFRLEDPAMVDPRLAQAAPKTPEGKLPVIYRVNMRDPVTFFAAQHFPMRDRDVLYVTNAPATDLQKFVNVIGAAVYPIFTAKAAGF
jgi:polysaccharide biosynthesis/export protein